MPHKCCCYSAILFFHRNKTKQRKRERERKKNNAKNVTSFHFRNEMECLVICSFCSAFTINPSRTKCLLIHLRLFVSIPTTPLIQFFSFVVSLNGVRYVARQVLRCSLLVLSSCNGDVLVASESSFIYSRREKKHNVAIFQNNSL